MISNPGKPILLHLKNHYKDVNVWKESFVVLLFLFIPMFAAFCATDVNFLSIHRKLLLSFGKNSIFTYFLIVLLRGFYPFKNSKNEFLTSLLVPLLWTIIYSYLFCYYKNYTSYFYNYFGSNMLFVFCYSFSCIYKSISVKTFVERIISFLYVVFLFICALPPVTCFVYFRKYHRPIDDFSFMSILGTNFAEAKEYLLTIFSQNEIMLLAVSLCGVFAILYYVVSNFSTIKVADSEIALGALLVCVLASAGIFYHFLLKIFPFDRYKALYRLDGGPLYVFSEFKHNVRQNADTVQILKNDSLKPQTVILVIGESANRDFMSSFNSELKENTTPWERSMRRSGRFIFFDKAYSNFSNTVMALSHALTSVNQYNGIELKRAVTILDIAKKAGYDTYWVSTQGRGSIWDAGITVIANQADNVKWIRGYDIAVVKALDSVDKSRNNFIIIHINGSHHNYAKRFPAAFSQKGVIANSSDNRDYKYSLLYTDEVLKKIFQYANRKISLKAMVYCSDHGEDMEYCHVSDPFFYSMVRIPLWVYLSPDYANKYPETFNRLNKNRNKVFTNDLLFDMMHGILQCKSNYYEQKYDLTQAEYFLTKENARTMHGARKIADDPE